MKVIIFIICVFGFFSSGLTSRECILMGMYKRPGQSSHSNYNFVRPYLRRSQLSQSRNIIDEKYKNLTWKLFFKRVMMLLIIQHSKVHFSLANSMKTLLFSICKPLITIRQNDNKVSESDSNFRWCIFVAICWNYHQTTLNRVFNRCKDGYYFADQQNIGALKAQREKQGFWQHCTLYIVFCLIYYNNIINLIKWER